MEPLVAAEGLEEYFRICGITPPSLDTLAGLSAIATSQISEWCNRRFDLGTREETLNGNGGVAISTRDYPIASVQSIFIDGRNIPASQGAGAGFVFSDTQIALRGYRFSRGIANICIVYEAGYCCIPAAISGTVCEAAAAMYDAMTRGSYGAVSLKAGGSAVVFPSSDVAAKLCLTPNITSVLRQFQRVVPC